MTIQEFANSLGLTMTAEPLAESHTNYRRDMFNWLVKITDANGREFETTFFCGGAHVERRTPESVKVSNMRGNNGKEVPNQFIIETESGLYFQSYKSIVAVKLFTGSGVKILLDRGTWDYSQTTGKYRNDFLGEKRPDTVRKIKTGVYELADLN